MTDPEFIIFTGPMFGSKTTRLLAVVDRYTRQNKRVLAFKPMMDDRYASSDIATHSGGRLPAFSVKSGGEILNLARQPQTEPVEIVAVDEAFMIDDCADALVELFREGKTIVVSSLQLSASGMVFEEVRDMMPWATKIEVCPAVCPITGRNAFYTHRKLEGLDEIVVGGEDLYEPRCWEHHGYMNRRQGHGSS
jgi:thymidine kinase